MNSASRDTNKPQEQIARNPEVLFCTPYASASVAAKAFNSHTAFLMSEAASLQKVVRQKGHNCSLFVILTCYMDDLVLVQPAEVAGPLCRADVTLLKAPRS